MPDKLMDISFWAFLTQIFGPGGVVLLITNAGAGYLIYMMWKRLKEKDTEWIAEQLNAENRWELRFQQMRGDVKEAFGIVADLTKQTTLLAERSATTRSRSS